MASARTAAAHVAKLLDGAATPIWLIDEDRKVVFCNAACATWLGVPVESLLGRQCNYHSSPTVAQEDRAAALLCPPPEVFAGERHQSLLPGADDVRHPATFIPLAGESGEITLVFATLGQARTPQEETHDSDALLHAVLREFRTRQMRNFSLDRLIGKSPQIALARERVRLAIDSAASVLIAGQPGTGRNHLARTVHERGGAPFGPLIPLACGSLSAELLISALDTAVKNHPAPNPATAPTGTLLLTDLDLLPREATLEFTRRLVPPRTSLRIVATCTRLLARLVGEREFPQTLAYAVGAIEIHLPPLVERMQDLPLLAQALLEDVNATGGKQVSGFLPETLDMLSAHRWSGNLDELAAVVAESHERATGMKVAPRDLPKSILLTAEATARPMREDAAIDLVAFLERVERELIERALSRAKGNKSRAAKMLGMTRPKFYRRLIQLKLLQP